LIRRLDVFGGAASEPRRAAERAVALNHTDALGERTTLEPWSSLVH
jgi:hypothetical protein